jgi:hypothetical protein
MSKKSGIHSIKPVDFSKYVQKFRAYTTTTGIKILLKAIPLKLVDASNDKVKDPPIPTYKMEIYGGGEQEDTLTEDVVIGFEASDPDNGKKYREIYNSYMEALAQASDEREKKLTKIILLRGVEFEIPNEEGWLEEMEFMGIEVPESKLKRRFFYLDHEIMSNPRDMAAIFDGVMRISGVPKEALADAMNSFRDILEDEEQEEDTAQ